MRLVNDRATHAWGSLGVGLTLLLATAPLAEMIDEGPGSPWWQLPGLAIGGLFALLGVWLLLYKSKFAFTAPPSRNETAASLQASKGGQVNVNKAYYVGRSDPIARAEDSESAVNIDHLSSNERDEPTH